MNFRSAYLHVPFCQHRCGYCNFTVVAGRPDLVDKYLDAIEFELKQLTQPHPIDTLFWGGGTPSWLDPHQLQRLIELCHYWLPLNPQGEWSCEANPLDCTSDKLRLLCQAGVNRLSLGGQSFQDHKLRVLERDHTSNQLHESIVRAQEHFCSVSIDLIFAAPGETLADWLRDVETAISLDVDHLSTYGLTIEKGSAFYGRSLRGQLHPATETLELDMYCAAIDRLTQAGFEHYEVSNFAKQNHWCRHNEAYWLGQPWLGLGPGAAGFDGRSRTVNHRSLSTYLKRISLQQSPVEERDWLSDQQLLRERFVFGMRRLAGVDLKELATSAIPDPARLFEPHLDRAISHGWFVRQGSHVRLSRAGLVISDALWPDFLG